MALSTIASLVGVAVLAAVVGVTYRLFRKSDRHVPPLRFGHAFPHPKDLVADPVGEAYAVLTGTAGLGPRMPQKSSVVWEAERQLGIDPAKRPVYTFVGCLHPALGRIGFIVSEGWFGREPHGVSRCDTGGLAGRIGGFSFLDQREAVAALVELSHKPSLPWEKHLLAEVHSAFGQFRQYLTGDPPKPSCYRDVRQKCIDEVRRTREGLDRRLWTWEARGFAEIAVGDVEAVAIAPEAWKELSALLDGEIPSGVNFLIGRVGATGTHHFSEDGVVAAFESRSA